MRQEQCRLSGIRLLSGLPPKALSKIEEQCRWCEFPAGAMILDRDSGDRDVYFVVQGSVQIVNYSLSGRKIALARIAAGSYFGELPVKARSRVRELPLSLCFTRHFFATRL